MLASLVGAREVHWRCHQRGLSSSPLCQYITLDGEQVGLAKQLKASLCNKDAARAATTNDDVTDAAATHSGLCSL